MVYQEGDQPGSRPASPGVNRRGFFSHFIPSTNTLPFSNLPNVLDNVHVSRRGVLVGGTLALSPWWVPIAHTTYVENRRKFELNLNSLEDIPDDSVTIGFSADHEYAATLEEKLRYPITVRNIFHNWNIGGRNSRDHSSGIINSERDPQDDMDILFQLKRLHSHNILPMLTTGPGGCAVDRKFYLKQIIDDPLIRDYLHNFFAQLEALGDPVLVRLLIEANGSWMAFGKDTNSPQDFIAAWRTIHQIIQEVGAKNIFTVWCPNHSLNEFNTNPIHLYYPEDLDHPCVDIVGLNVFDWYVENLIELTEEGLVINIDGHLIQVNASPQATFGPDLAFLQKLGKPMAICELGSKRKGINRANWEGEAIRLALEGGMRLIMPFVLNKKGQGLTERNWNLEPEVLAMMNNVVHQPCLFDRSKINSPWDTLKKIFTGYPPPYSLR